MVERVDILTFSLLVWPCIDAVVEGRILFCILVGVFDLIRKIEIESVVEVVEMLAYVFQVVSEGVNLKQLDEDLIEIDINDLSCLAVSKFPETFMVNNLQQFLIFLALLHLVLELPQELLQFAAVDLLHAQVVVRLEVFNGQPVLFKMHLFVKHKEEQILLEKMMLVVVHVLQFVDFFLLLLLGLGLAGFGLKCAVLIACGMVN
jgi:hypothetical protein